MADVRLNLFESWPLIHQSVSSSTYAGTLKLFGIVLPGSISFNSIVLPIERAGGVGTGTLTLSFGLYSLTGSTLSLANSASLSTSSGAANLRWISLSNTSATQDLTPGNWYFGLVYTFSSYDFSFIVQQTMGGNSESTNVGNFVSGKLSVTTGALPASIATSDLNKLPPSGLNTQFPYILLSA